MSKFFYGYCLVVLFVVGCQPIATSYSTPVLETQTSNEEAVETQIIPTSEINLTIEPNPTTLTLPEIVLNNISTTNNSETKLNNQCVKVTSVPPASNSIIALRSLKDVVAGQYPDIILIDMAEAPPGQTIQKINITPDFFVSPNRELISYRASTLVNGDVTNIDLDIANGNFQVQKTIPYEGQWYSILGWTADQKVIISLLRAETSSSSVSYVLIDPINGTQQAIHFDISDFMDESLYDVPYWESWYGVLLDPTLKWAVYPKASNVNADMYTYALWNISSNKPMFSLEKIFSSSWFFIHASPMPSWSTDGKQFAFVGRRQDESPGEYELFLVNINGDIKQLTNLSAIGYLWPSFHSWSPDNNYIAFFLSSPQAMRSDVANVAIVNINTRDVIDLCLSIDFQGAGPIWSPNGKQFLVVDEYEEGHQRVLLVDIEKDIVFPIAEDAEPIGWMVKP